MSNLSVTYQEVADQYLGVKYKDMDGAEAEKQEIMEFAKYLDGFAVLDDKLQILAYQKAREIDREVLFAMARELPKAKVEEIISGVYAKHHKHKTNERTDTSESPATDGGSEPEAAS